MRVVLPLFLLLFSSQTLPVAQRDSNDPYSLIAVKNAMDRTSEGIGFGGDAKTIPRLGDACAVAILKLFDRDKLIQADTARAVAGMIRWSFTRPEWISNAEDRDPKVSLFLLDYLNEKVSDPDIVREIQKTIDSLHHLPVAVSEPAK